MTEFRNRMPSVNARFLCLRSFANFKRKDNDDNCRLMCVVIVFAGFRGSQFQTLSRPSTNYSLFSCSINIYETMFQVKKENRIEISLLLKM